MAFLPSSLTMYSQVIPSWRSPRGGLLSMKFLPALEFPTSRCTLASRIRSSRSSAKRRSLQNPPTASAVSRRTVMPEDSTGKRSQVSAHSKAGAESVKVGMRASRGASLVVMITEDDRTQTMLALPNAVRAAVSRRGR